VKQARIVIPCNSCYVSTLFEEPVCAYDRWMLACPGWRVFLASCAPVHAWPAEFPKTEKSFSLRPLRLCGEYFSSVSECITD